MTEKASDGPADPTGGHSDSGGRAAEPASVDDRRRDADRELVERLGPDFAGPAWVRFAEELLRYGLATVGAWLDSQQIFERCRQSGRPCDPPPSGWTRADRVEIAQDAVIAAIHRFRLALIDDRWDPDGDVGLIKYFIDTCIDAFPDQLQQWSDHRQAEVEEPVEPGSAILLQLPSYADVEAHVLNALTFTEHVAAIGKSRTRTAVVLRAQGYTYAQIAELLTADEGTSVTARMVEGLLRRHRQRGSSQWGSSL